MVETRINPDTGNTDSATPETITTSMILEDLENGIDRTGIKTKYNLEAWEVKQMFDHPVLKGKKAKRVKKLSFNFVDDTVHTDPDTGKKTKYYFKNPKKYPESYTKEDIKFLKDQREDVVREEDKS